MATKFDPYAILQALERQRVIYRGRGRARPGAAGLGRADRAGWTSSPLMREENLRLLERALEDLKARRADGKPLALERDLARCRCSSSRPSAGELKLVPEPAGTRGYDDLRRHAKREPIGQGLRPSVASLDDHARMLSALDRDQDREPLLTIRRLIELEHGLDRGRSLER